MYGIEGFRLEVHTVVVGASVLINGGGVTVTDLKLN